MNPASLSAVGNHLWQSTAFAVGVWLLTLVLRGNSARVRHGVWLAASVKFLAPVAVLIGLGGEIARWTASWRAHPPVSRAGVVVVMDEISQPFGDPVTPFGPVPVAMSAHVERQLPITPILWVLWGCGFIGIGCAWLVRWLRIRAAVLAGTPLQLNVPICVVISSTTLEPGVFGICQPVLMLPEGIHGRLTPEQLEAVIAHELCHVRNRDNLIGAIQMFVETVFWFYPIVWWIGKRMVAERERACDEEVLSQAARERRVYADAILAVCRMYVESPVACVAGVTGSDLKRRIEAIMANRIGQRMSRAKRLLLACAALVAVAGPLAMGVATGIVNVPAVLAKVPVASKTIAPTQQIIPPPPLVKGAVAQSQPVEIAQVRPVPAPQVHSANPALATDSSAVVNPNGCPNMGGGGESRLGPTGMVVTYRFPQFYVAGLAGAPFSGRYVNGQGTVQPMMYRDSLGRTRIDSMMSPATPRVPAHIARLAEINDSVAGDKYYIDDFHKVAYRVKPCIWPAFPPVLNPDTLAPEAAARGITLATESLGTQTMSGVVVTGRRETRTFPPGTYQGNDQPVTTVEERWHSDQLGIDFLTKNTYPNRESTQTLSDFVAGEPDPALFRVPDGYQIVDETTDFQVTIPIPGQ